MAGTQLMPISVFAVTAGFVFPNVHVGAGANSKQDEGLGVADATTLTTDAIWRLRFKVPKNLPVLPGTPTLMLDALANATSGAAKFNPKWASVAAEESPSGATLNAEGTQTITWASGDNDQYKHAEVTLDADTVVAGETIVMDLVFEDTNFTLAVVSTWQVWVEWV